MFNIEVIKFEADVIVTSAEGGNENTTERD